MAPPRYLSSIASMSHHSQILFKLSSQSPPSGIVLFAGHPSWLLAHETEAIRLFAPPPVTPFLEGSRLRSTPQARLMTCFPSFGCQSLYLPLPSSSRKQYG